MKTSENNPPKLFVKFFRWFCHPDFREEIEGDLFEMYRKYSEPFGEKKANLFFIKEVLLLLRPSLVGNINQLTHLNSTVMMSKNRRLLGILAIIAGLLLIPFIAMQLSDEVQWGIFDFMVMGFLLLSVGLFCEFVLRKVKTIQTRIIICGAVLLAFLLVWAELAVGVFGTPFAGH
jgi:hypothetical protein